MTKDFLRHGSAFCIGIVAFAFSVPGAGMAAVLSGSAFLSTGFARFREGRKELREVESAQARCRGGFLTLAREVPDGAAQIEAMDAFLGPAMNRIEIRREDLSGLVEGGAFVDRASDLLMDRLGVSGSGHPEFAQRYAREMIIAGLNSAMNGERMFRALTLESIFGLHGRLDQIEQRIRNQIPRKLLENLALRFDHGNPDAPVAELAEFIKATAREWKRLKARLAALEEIDSRLANARGAAEAALARADFEAADEILAAAEEMQAERALVEVRRRADLRTARADAALLAGDADRAAAHFETAAGFLLPFAPGEAASVRHAGARRLAQEGRRLSGTGLLRAIELYRRNEAIWTRAAYPVDWARTQCNLGNVLAGQAERTEGPAGGRLVAQAVAACRAALEVCTRATHPVFWAATHNNLGVALCIQAARTELGDDAGKLGLGAAMEAFAACGMEWLKKQSARDSARVTGKLGRG